MKKLLLISVLFFAASVAKAQSSGDVNNDGKVNAADVVAVYNLIINGWTEPVDDNYDFTVNGVSFKMIPVEGGTFEMGATPEQENVEDLEKPVHTVTVSNYAIGETEVTQELWEAVMGENPSFVKGANLPVESVSWYDCQIFMLYLNRLTGRNFRFPTEAEWEYAARGGNKGKGYQYSGNWDIYEVAWFDFNSDKKAHPVKGKQPNELGIYDMSGNAWEWCLDWRGYYSDEAQFNPVGPVSGLSHICRGGGWDFSAKRCRTSYRDYKSPSTHGLSLSMRLCLSPEKAENPGDVNKDGLVNSADVVAVYNEIINGSESDGGIETYTVNGVSFKMISVEGGTFDMGATPEQENAYGDEKPVHQVTLSNYAMGETEVTQALWDAVMRSNPSDFSGADLPVEDIKWDDCYVFITRLNILTGCNFRIPTEAEWEYAARGGKLSKGYQYSGSGNIEDVAWCQANSENRTHPVKSKQPNELGLYDMSGNVQEWCQDWWAYYPKDSQTDPIGPNNDGPTRVARGGGWGDDAGSCRSARRARYDSDVHRSNIGFRLCLSK